VAQGRKSLLLGLQRFLESSSNTVKLSCAGHYVYLRVFEATLETSKGLEIQINRQIATRSHWAPQNLWSYQIQAKSEERGSKQMGNNAVGMVVRNAHACVQRTSP